MSEEKSISGLLNLPGPTERMVQPRPRATPAYAEANVNRTLERWWLACTQAACDFKRNNFWRIQAFTIGLTECTAQLKARCCDSLLHIHGQAAGEVGIVQCTIDALADARRFMVSDDLRKGLLFDSKVPTVMPNLLTFEGQAAAVIWYCAGWMYQKPEESIYQVPLTWHYGPAATTKDDAEWEKYRNRWDEQLKTARAWAGKKGEGA